MNPNDEVISLTRALLRFDTINPPGDESLCMAFLADYLQQHGFSIHLQRFGERRFNLVARLAGRRAYDKPLAFTGHVDTVPLGNADWRFDAFAGEISDGRLYGRGASDMKAAIAAFIVACRQQHEAITSGSGVVLVLTGGEETGCDGARALINETRDYLPAVGALIVGEPTANYPVIGHKGALWLRCETRGKTAHGAMPELGINAIYLAAEAIGKIRYFEPGAPHPLMKQPTLNVGTISGGLNINSVPDRSWFDVDIRTAPNLRHEEIRQRLTTLMGDTVTVTTLVDLPSILSEPHNGWIRRVFERCAPLHDAPLQPRVVPYFTDASLLLEALGAPPCIILGPGEPAMAHQTDEYCAVDKLLQAVTLYGDLISDWGRRGAA
ncbi:M20 family metallopeptidase [Acerihabitans arboris]|uniref:M20/M25/M40 family metallo-hydrolase n=1 Tax=Acerihabitans arboris TaxID=2691583 RepID=A0A845SJR3_9GAMM|nr:M20 family metallopeptidase [Acerihabitans arboris]NDL65160.1 M20/M25/M40 family metallo-hydrolase [Acerihabitans arboris]